MRFSIIILVLTSLARMALAQMPGPPPKGGFPRGDSCRPLPPPVYDSLRMLTEADMLALRLKLDSAQTAYMAGVLQRRDRLLRTQRGAPVKDRTIVELRAKKVVAEADRDIERKLNEEQLREYRRYVKEREARTAKKDRRGPAGGPPPGPPPGGPGGGRGLPTDDW